MEQNLLIDCRYYFCANEGSRENSRMCEHNNKHKTTKKSISFKNRSIFYFPQGKLHNPVTPVKDCLVTTIETEQ